MKKKERMSAVRVAVSTTPQTKVFMYCINVKTEDIQGFSGRNHFVCRVDRVSMTLVFQYLCSHKFRPQPVKGSGCEEHSWCHYHPSRINEYNASCICSLDSPVYR